MKMERYLTSSKLLQLKPLSNDNRVKDLQSELPSPQIPAFSKYRVSPLTTFPRAHAGKAQPAVPGGGFSDAQK